MLKYSPQPGFEIVGVGYNRTLGGLDFQISLRNYLAEKFQSIHKTKINVYSNSKAMVKLFREATKVKKVLSANKYDYAQIENVMEDCDLNFKISRDLFVAINQDYLKSILDPVKMALKDSKLNMNNISEVILYGGATRMPIVQDILQKHFNRNLGKMLNTDEAAALGSVYFGAKLLYPDDFKVNTYIVFFCKSEWSKILTK